MRIRLLVDISGTRDGVPWPGRGNEMDLPDDEAKQMIESSQAIPVARRATETATPDEVPTETREATEQPLTRKSGPRGR